MEERGRLERRGPTLRRSRTSGRANSASAAERVPRKTTATTTSRPSNLHPLAPPWRCSAMVAWCFASASTQVAIDPGPRDPIDDDLRMRVQDRTKESRNTVLGTGRCCPSKSRSLARHRSQGRVSYTEKAKRPPRERRGTGGRTTATGHLISRPSDRRARSPLLLPAVTPLLSPASDAGNDEPDKPGYARPKHGGLDEHWAHGVLLR